MPSFETIRRSAHPARHLFKELIAKDPIPMAETSFVLASEEYEQLDVAAQIRRLDRLGEQANELLFGIDDPVDRLAGLTTFLFEDCAFEGNQDDYYDPRNSYLHEVLDRRVGIPISLSVICIEVGRRAGVPLTGIGFPTHFLVGHELLDGLYIDPFHGGRILSAEDCKEMLSQATRGRVSFRSSLLEPIGTRRILLRLLSNLKSIYARDEDLGRALAAAERISLLAPRSAVHKRERGLLYLEIGAVNEAVDDLQYYLAHMPRASDAIAVRAHLQRAMRRMSMLN